MANPKADDDSLPPARAAAQVQREAELFRLLGKDSLKPADLLGPALKRGLSARLSPNEESTLRRVAHTPGGSAGAFNSGHVARLVSLNLVALDGTTLAITPLGKQRILLAK